MTEAEWLACTEPQKMLSFLSQRDASARKFRLFTTACARRLWLVMSSDHPRKIVLDAERFADGLLSEARRQEQEQRFRATFPPRMTPDQPMPPWYLADMVAYYTIWSNSAANPGHTLHLNEHGANCVSQWVGFTLVYQETDNWAAWPASNHPIGRVEGNTHCLMIRDLFGNPFRPLALDPSWLTWHDATIPALAQSAYDDRHLPSGHLDNHRLAVLADALTDVGCSDPDILAHCRGPGSHGRGCWVIDLLLGSG
jgi:hypothetical protein